MAEHKAICPQCAAVRTVSRSVACMIRKGRKKGLCATCADANRRTCRNTGQFRPGHVPCNKKPQDPTITKEENRLRKLRWRHENRDHVNAYFRDYHAANLERRRLSLRIARLKRRMSGDIDRSTVERVLAKHSIDGAIRCYLCHQPCPSHWEIDHIRPLANGGGNHEENLAIACRGCNRRKSSKTIEQFLADQASTMH